MTYNHRFARERVAKFMTTLFICGKGGDDIAIVNDWIC